LRSTETVEEAAIHRAVAEQAGIAGVAVGNDRLGAVAGDDLAIAIGDRRQRLRPGNAFEARPGALAADPAQGVEQAVRVIDALGVEGHLGAQHAGGRRVIGRAGDLDDATVADAHFERAGVRAIVRAGTAYAVPAGGGGGGRAHGASPVLWLRCCEDSSFRSFPAACRGEHFLPYDVCAGR